VTPLPALSSDQSSAVAAAFDSLAPHYDAAWTETFIGRLQRQQVWRELQSTFRTGERVLEFGCGTGADAAFLARAGVRVHATDPRDAGAAQGQNGREELTDCATLRTAHWTAAAAGRPVVWWAFSISAPSTACRT
jgi:ubiquinone/menaquinone biosynthesis C-methylase UbiE